MHLACVNQDPGIGPERKKGAAVHLAAMRDAFRSLGHRVSAVDRPESQRVEAELDAAAAEEPLGCVYERYALDAYAASEYAHARSIPHVLEVNAPLAEEAQAHRGRAIQIDAERERALFAGADLVLVVSNALKDWVIARGAAAERVLVRPNAVDASRFRPLAPAERARLGGTPRGAFVLGFHGRLRPWHNFELLLSAVQGLLERDIPAHLLCVGDESLGEHCRQSLPDGSYTHMAWLPQNQVAERVACFDVLPLTYAPQESFYFSPLKLLEAMACGVPVVVPDVGDLAQVVEHGLNGLVYPAGDRAALLEALIALHRDPALRTRMGAAARERALRSSWVDVAREVVEHVGGEREECRPR